MAGRFPLPHPWSGIPKGGAGPVTASGALALCAITIFGSTQPYDIVDAKKVQNSSHDTSTSPMKNGETVTLRTGPSSFLRKGSFSGLPILYVPPLTAIIL